MPPLFPAGYPDIPFPSPTAPSHGREGIPRAQRPPSSAAGRTRASGHSFRESPLPYRCGRIQADRSWSYPKKRGWSVLSPPELLPRRPSPTLEPVRMSLASAPPALALFRLLPQLHPPQSSYPALHPTPSCLP